MTREEAIRWLEDIHRRFNPTGENLENEGGDVHLQALDMAIEALTDIPIGHWIFNPKDAIELMFTLPKCSECGFESADCGNFCSNCGARMIEKDDEA